MENLFLLLTDSKQTDLPNVYEDIEIIQSSIHTYLSSLFFIGKEGPYKYLYVYGPHHEIFGFESIEAYGEMGFDLYQCDLNRHNYEKLATYFPWIKPTSRTDHPFSFGLGDRLGLATQAHIPLFKDKDVFPVFAQQSIRELMLNHRTYDDVILSAAWSVFELDFTTGYGADGDHLKHPYEIEYAIQAGFPTITLDASEYIKNEFFALDHDQLLAKFNEINPVLQQDYRDTYLNHSFDLSDHIALTFDEDELYRSVLVYRDAIDFATDIYHDYVVPYHLDFELSIDETETSTSFTNHLFIANELARRHVIVETMAPRFVGEFQKAIDYIGDLQTFEDEYQIHEAIARAYDYRLSIHSGSDKFSAFPIIAEYSNLGWHAKTAGTNWLEALRVIAKNDPDFLREMYSWAIENLDETKKYYHIDATYESAPTLDLFKGEQVFDLLSRNDTRQIFHVNYGMLLNKKVDGEYVFRNHFFDVLEAHMDDYTNYLNAHIGKHLDLLGVKTKV